MIPARPCLAALCLVPLVGTVGATLADRGVPPVQVIVDMDAGTPGIQSTITVPACTRVVPDVAIFIIDPLGRRSLFSIG